MFIYHNINERINAKIPEIRIDQIQPKIEEKLDSNTKIKL